jgi:hypothetical protein
MIHAFSEPEVNFLVHAFILESFCEPSLGSLHLSLVKLVVVVGLTCERPELFGIMFLNRVIAAVVLLFLVESFRLVRELLHFLLGGLVFVNL